MRPTKEDHAVMRLLLEDESLPERTAEFLDDLNNSPRRWTPKQAQWFDDIVEDRL